MSVINVESRSFDARIRAAKANESPVIPEGNLSEHEWTVETLGMRDPRRFEPSAVQKRELRMERAFQNQNDELQDYSADFQLLFSNSIYQSKWESKWAKKLKTAITEEGDGFVRKGRILHKTTTPKVVDFIHTNPFAVLGEDSKKSKSSLEAHNPNCSPYF